MPVPTVFVSCVSKEFEDKGAPFVGLRGRLRHYLAKAHVDVKVQEDFPLTDADTVLKMSDIIRDCRAVIHLVGALPGKVAHPKAVAEFRSKVPDFLAGHPELRAALGDCSDLTYTQWEAFLALHHGVSLRVYATTVVAKAQETHLERLRLGRNYPGARPITAPDDLLGQLIGDLKDIVPAAPPEPRIAPSRILRHAPDKLFGRDPWLAELDAAWSDDGVNVLALVAWGGVGKTALVAHWVATRFHTRKWPGVERYFDWSFYSQGADNSRQSSADLFIQAALTFFGDPDPVKGSAWERGERLAGLVRQHRTLLVLDGVEPLQYPPNDGQAGRFKDPALEALLHGLAADNRGLCVVTTREHLANVESQPAVREKKLDTLLRDAAVSLLRHLQLVGTEAEMTAAWHAAGGHALTLRLLGRLIARAYGKDVTKWREVKFEEADRLAQGRSAMRVMAKYEAWLGSASLAAQLELAVLRLTGLFDRPMSPDCFRALCAAPAIPNLTEQLVSARPSELEAALTTLVENDLLTHGGVEVPGVAYRHADLPIDAHPLIREYFAIQLRKEQPEALKAAHSRLFDHLCATTPHRPDTLEGLQPLYQAVVHGCHAHRHQEAFDRVFIDHIQRGTGIGGYYSTLQLGSIGADLAATAALFTQPWTTVAPSISEEDQAWLFNQAAYYLRALGRLAESLQPMTSGLEIYVKRGQWEYATILASNISESNVTIGRLAAAASDARQAMKYADLCGAERAQISARCKLAVASHQIGQLDQAGELFADAERIQQAMTGDRQYLYSLRGYNYCDFLLSRVECESWRRVLPDSPHLSKSTIELTALVEQCESVEKRGRTTLEWLVSGQLSLLSIAMDQLIIARIALYQTILTDTPTQTLLSRPLALQAVSNLRASGNLDELPRGLLTAALYHYVCGEYDAARRYLDETQQLAERGPMPLFLADVHLHRARMFRDTAELAKAAKLIRDLGYGRRYDELADAEAALG